MRAPEFWYGDGAVLPAVLAPFAAAYVLAGGLRRAATRPWRAPVPVVCVGNLTVGGAGKTPVALGIALRLAALGVDAHLLSRGYGGRLPGPLRVDPDRHDAGMVGDEPLLLARARPTWVARDRPAGIRAAVAAGARAIVMDDGLQNPTVAKDLALVVVDGRRGFGNGRVLPAGPLREPVADGLARAQAAVLMGCDAAGVAGALAPLPVLRAGLVPAGAAPDLRGRRVVAFAGIADPERFFETLAGLGCEIVATRAFPDHHRFRAGDLAAILDAADRHRALAVTTEKDRVRLPAAVRDRVETLPVSVAWDDEAALDRLLEGVVGRAG